MAGTEVGTHLGGLLVQVKVHLCLFILDCRDPQAGIALGVPGLQQNALLCPLGKQLLHGGALVGHPFGMLRQILRGQKDIVIANLAGSMNRVKGKGLRAGRSAEEQPQHHEEREDDFFLHVEIDHPSFSYPSACHPTSEIS